MHLTHDEMRVNNSVMENLLSGNNSSPYHFALCESCFWSATILKIKQDIVCPACPDGIVSLIPLARNESYRLNISPKTGFEVSFSTHKKSPA